MAKKAKQAPGVQALPARDSDKGKRQEMLDRTIQQIEKQYGQGSIQKLGASPGAAGIKAIPTGSLAMDIALGVGGVPRGRVIEIYGPEGSGKTTLALHIIANAQKAEGLAAFVDAEHALDPDWARSLGVDVDALLVNQPDTGEQALDIVEQLVRSNAVDVIVVDSVAALVPRAEIEGEMGDVQVGAQARLMSQALRKLTSAIAKSRTCCIFINQIRMKIGVMFGNPETTPGGKALKFYSSVRIDVRRITTIKEGEEAIGCRCRASVAKNKVAPPFRKAEFDMMFKSGISREGDLIDLGDQVGAIQKSGSWFAYGDTRIGQGRENACKFLAENPDVSLEVEKAILKELAPHLLHRLGEEPAPAAQTEKDA